MIISPHFLLINQDISFADTTLMHRDTDKPPLQ